MEEKIEKSAAADGIEKRLQQLGKDSFVYGLGGMAAKAVGFLLLPIYTRIFAPAEFGVIELLTVTNSFVGTILVLGTDAAQSYYFFEQKKEGKSAQSGVVSAILQFRLLWGAAVVILSTLLSPLLNHLCFDGKLSWEYFAISFTGALFAQMMNQSAEVFRLLYRPWAYIGVTLGSTVACAAAAITLVVGFHGGVMGYIIGFAVGSAIAAGFGWVRIRHYINLSQWHFDWWPRLLKFGLPLMPAGLVLLVMNTADRWFINSFQSQTELGLYAVASKFSLIIAMATENFRKAWWPIGIDAMHSEDGPGLFRMVSRLYLGMGMAGVVALTACSPWLVKWFTGSAYHDSYPIVGVLGFSSVFYGFFLISGAGSWKSERTIWTTIALAAGAILNIILNFLWVPRFSGLGAAVATSISMLVSNMILVVRGEQLWRVDFPLGVLLIQVVTAAASVAGILAIDLYGGPQWAVWVITALSAGALFAMAGGERGFAMVQKWRAGANR